MTDRGDIAEILRKHLHTKWAGKPLLFYETIDSTNEQCRQEARMGAPHGTLIVADMQTAGKGRRGRRWESPAGANIYFSLLLRPELSVNNVSMLTLVMAHSVCCAIRSKTGLECGIKWPNDIVVDGRKVCGILTELEMQKSAYAVIVGVGVNVMHQDFEEELAIKATSLEDALADRKDTGRAYSPDFSVKFLKNALITEILHCFEADYERFVSSQNLSPFVEAYNNMLVNLGRQVRVLDPKEEFSGVARGINEVGELLVEKQSGEMIPVYAGEVSVRGIYGYV